MDTHPTQPNKKPAYLGWGIAVLLVMLAWVGAFAMRGGGEKVALQGWQDGITVGQVKAEELDRPMVVMFTADWCGACQTLKRDVLNQPEVQQTLAEQFVLVKVDLTDQSPSNPNMAAAQRYGIEYLPTLVVISPEGETIGRVVGGGKPQVASVKAFNAWLASLQ